MEKEIVCGWKIPPSCKPFLCGCSLFGRGWDCGVLPLGEVELELVFVSLLVRWIVVVWLRVCPSLWRGLSLYYLGGIVLVERGVRYSYWIRNPSRWRRGRRARGSNLETHLCLCVWSIDSKLPLSLFVLCIIHIIFACVVPCIFHIVIYPLYAWLVFVCLTCA